jgi:hypothetical protein
VYRKQLFQSPLISVKGKKENRQGEVPTEGRTQSERNLAHDLTTERGQGRVSDADPVWCFCGPLDPDPGSRTSFSRILDLGYNHTTIFSEIQVPIFWVKNT